MLISQHEYKRENIIKKNFTIIHYHLKMDKYNIVHYLYKLLKSELGSGIKRREKH